MPDDACRVHFLLAMHIRNLGTATAGDRAVARADVVWEASARPAFELRFDVPVQFGHLLVANPDAFLVAALFPAQHAGEARIVIDSPVCPLLVHNLETAQQWHHQWFGAPLLSIEGALRTSPMAKPEGAGSLLSFSGGADCLHTLRRNRLEVPAGHEASITHGLLIEGFDMRRGNTYERALAAAREVAADAGVTLVPVRTNVRDLDLDDEFWDERFHGSALASVAHAFAGSFRIAYIASGIEIESLWPWGSHPLVDPLYSSVDLRIRHDSAEVPRLEKIRLLAGWPAALANMRVCYRQPQESLNCGRCEKCVRTMLELVAVAALDRGGAFPMRDVTPAMLREVRLYLDYHCVRWAEMVPDLERQGRADLVAEVHDAIARFRRWDKWKHERDWKGRVKRFDRRFTGGLISRIAAAAGRGTATPP